MSRRIVLQRCFASLFLAVSLWVAPAAAQRRDTFSPAQDAPRRPAGPNAARAARANSINAFVQRLMEVEPDRRKELLANNRRFQRLPSAQRRAIENRLREFDKLPAERRELLIQRYQLFSRLGPNQKTQARSLFREWTALPRPRRTAIVQAVRRLRNAQPEARAEMMASERYATLFGESERDLIERLLELAPPTDQRRER
ncbi:MAG: DUF3106 domain-containing protein [Acidobacteria bacterium]|nr:DUF3106 domain-containing protein [Acidobacteriota bacterium]MDA1233219.1 DUF3106 domain-containing protein [Acidobacteriota bacterium]